MEDPFSQIWSHICMYNIQEGGETPLDIAIHYNKPNTVNYLNYIVQEMSSIDQVSLILMYIQIHFYARIIQNICGLV